jgi:hypothetical protein
MPLGLGKAAQVLGVVGVGVFGLFLVVGALTPA